MRKHAARLMHHRRRNRKQAGGAAVLAVMLVIAGAAVKAGCDTSTPPPRKSARKQTTPARAPAPASSPTPTPAETPAPVVVATTVPAPEHVEPKAEPEEAIMPEKPTGPAPEARIASVVPAARQPHESHADTIWYDDFDAGMKPYAESSGPIDTAVAFGGSGGSLKCHYAKGTKGKGDRKIVFGDTAIYKNKAVRRGEKFEEIYWRVYVKHQPGWIGGGPAKLARATSMCGPGWAQAMINHVWASGKDKLTLDPARLVHDGKVKSTRYNDFDAMKWLGNSPAADFPISSTEESGWWVAVECRTKLNTPGKKDGLAQLWIDGKLGTERKNLDFRGTYTKHGINAVFFETYWNKNSPVDQSRWYDNIVVSTAPIGPVVCPRNPELLLTAYRGDDDLVAWEVQVAADTRGTDVVFTSNTNKAQPRITIDAAHGKFGGSLKDKDALAPGATYHVRVRQKGTRTFWSAWSHWHQGFAVQ